MPSQSERPTLKELLVSGDPAFAESLTARTQDAREFSELLQLCTMRKRALAKGLLEKPAKTRRIAMVGGASLKPMIDLIEHFATVLGNVHCEIWTGAFDNYYSEILDESSELYAFAPEVVLVLPSEQRCVYNGPLTASRAEQEDAGRKVARELGMLCSTIHSRCGAEVVLGNFRLPPYYDPGPMRSTSLTSDYAFRRFVNTELASSLEAFVHLCDIEFLSNRFGNLAGVDTRIWFESKQPFAAGLMVDVAREYAHVMNGISVATKKVIVLDLDNTLWGGVIGDDGVEGIELGATSPRGEAFRAFQQYLLELNRRGVLLAVCSKNDHDKAIEPFEKHPEMLIRLKDIACFRANWEPKSDNLRMIAQQLNLGVDSLVFVDDNRAEIEIVNQFAPEVTALWLGDDPSTFIQKVKDARCFEMRTITAEDTQRAEQYAQESQRQMLLESATDMDVYLASLEMTAAVKPFDNIDVPRIAQLIAKSNQFNLTTRRRTEVEVQEMVGNERYEAFTMRLKDRFGDHGLIAIVVTEPRGTDLEIDTWLMSCRVLKRQVEEETLNHIVRLAEERGCSRVIGRYIPTAKNGMVSELYTRMGFAHISAEPDGTQVFELNVAEYQSKISRISIDIDREAYAAAGSA